MPAKKTAARKPTKRVTKKKTPVVSLETAAEQTLVPVRLDVACGQQKIEGWIGVDAVATDVTDVVHDLEISPWPFEDNSVDEARCIHFVEHVHDLIGFMNELHRVMKPGAQCLVITPYYTSMRAFQDPTHVRFMAETSYLYFNQDWLRSNALDHYGITADFDFTYGYAVTQDWQNRSEESRVFAIRHYWNVVDDLVVTLTKKPPAE